MKNDRAVNDISNLAGNRYPHLKLTAGEFPRVLATRRIEDDGDEYFGAFLPKTAARILIDFLNKTFRLRGCDIDIDGSWDVPCTQFYRRRCVAPCVTKLCSRNEYNRLAALTRFVIADQKGLFRKAVGEIIEQYAEDLDFERAAYYRDILLAVEKFWDNDRWQVWLDDTVDTFAVEDTPGGISIFLVSHRNRRVLGRKVFRVDREDFEDPGKAFADLLDSFYLFHLPREIRVSRDFQGRRDLAERLTERHGRIAGIIVANPAAKGVSAFRGLTLSRDETDLDKIKPLASPEIISAKLRRIFNLNDRPRWIEAFDVAHISGTGFVAASSVWIDGHFASEHFKFQISDLKSEISVLAESVRRTIVDQIRQNPPYSQSGPDLILLDGGKPQLNAVLKAVSGLPDRPPIIAAVKPPGKHSSIAAFLTDVGRSISFDIDSPAHAMLQLLRDEAHTLANRIHRDYREMKPFYEAAGHDEPVIVPIRLHAENGGAEDLIPIETR